MKITLELLNDQKAKAERDLALARNKYEIQTEKFKKAFQERAGKIFASFNELAERYFLENLTDKNGKPILKGHIISDDGVSFYKVKDHMFSRDHKGRLTFTFITCSRIGQKKSKEVNISSDDLKQFEIKGKGSHDESHD